MPPRNSSRMKAPLAEWLSRSPSEALKLDVQRAYVRFLHLVGSSPQEYLGKSVSLKELYIYLVEVNQQWKKVPMAEMVTSHTCFNTLTTHLSRWRQRCDEVSVFYMGEFPDEDTHSEGEEEDQMMAFIGSDSGQRELL